MKVLVAILGVMLVVVILRDAFETIVLPRRGTRKFRLTRIYFLSTWRPWVARARRMRQARQRENFLSYFGPLSLLGLLACWALLLIFGYALIYWPLGQKVAPGGGWSQFGLDMYLSGTTFFTLGIGDVVPRSPLARLLVVAESGLGFAFLALCIGYLPVIYQAFSRREMTISLMDARGGSPPTAGELLRRHTSCDGYEALLEVFRDWEKWSAELMESHLSYAVLCFYRSQHDNQSWLAAVCTMLDSCAFVMAEVEGTCQRQAELTFAVARHALVDLAAIFVGKPAQSSRDRLPPDALARMRAELRTAGFRLRGTDEAERKLADYRKLYEPFAQALADYLCFRVPDWLPPAKAVDNWQTTAWGRQPGFWHDEIDQEIEIQQAAALLREK